MPVSPEVMSPKRKARILELPEVEQRCATTWSEAVELQFCTDWKSFCEMRAAAMSSFWLGRVATPPHAGDSGKTRVTSKAKKLARRERLRAKLKAIELEMGPAEVADAGV